MVKYRTYRENTITNKENLKNISFLGARLLAPPPGTPGDSIYTEKQQKNVRISYPE